MVELELPFGLEELHAITQGNTNGFLDPTSDITDCKPNDMGQKCIIGRFRSVQVLSIFAQTSTAKSAVVDVEAEIVKIVRKHLQKLRIFQYFHCAFIQHRS